MINCPFLGGLHDQCQSPNKVEDNNAKMKNILNIAPPIFYPSIPDFIRD